MISITTTPARQWLHLIGLGLALAVVIVVALAVALPAAALTLALALLVMGLGLVAQRVRTVAGAARAAVAGVVADEAATPTLELMLGDGELLSARAVALPVQSEHTLVLTRRGYMLLDAEGEVFHRL
jgi:hypothetical protein